MADLPWVHKCALDDLRAGPGSTCAVFRTDEALHAGVQLYETFRDRREVCRYPPRLLHWIHALGPEEVCKGLNGHNEEAARTLEALRILGDQLPPNVAFTQRLHVSATDRRDRDGWVAAELEVADGVKLEKVSKDLAPFELPYSAYVLAARTCAGARGGWAGAVAVARLPRYPGGGSTPPAAGALAAAAPAAAAPAAAAPAVAAPDQAHRAPRDVPRIVVFDLVDHRDVPDAALDILDSTPAERVPNALARIVACDPENLRGPSTRMLITSLCHTLVSIGESVAQWAHEPTTGCVRSTPSVCCGSKAAATSARYWCGRPAWRTTGRNAATITARTAGVGTLGRRRRSVTVVRPGATVTRPPGVIEEQTLWVGRPAGDREVSLLVVVVVVSRYR